jgi:hypothetical protein
VAAAAPLPAFQPFGEAAPGVYGLDGSGTDASYGWTLYVLSASDAPPSGPIAAGDAFNKYQGSYLFSPAKPSAAALQTLSANVAVFLRNISRLPPRALIWLPDPSLANPLPAQSSRYAIPFVFQSLSRAYQTQFQDFSAWLGPDGLATFTVTRNTFVGWDPNRQAITLLGSALNGLIFRRGGGGTGGGNPTPSNNNAGLIVARGSVASGLADAIIALSGNRAGSLTMTTQMTPSFTFPLLKPSFGYWANDAGTDVSCSFPAFVDAPSGTIALATAIDPADLLNLLLPETGPVTLNGGQIRTGFGVTTQQPGWKSCFRTVEGKSVALAPLGTASDPFAGPADRAGGFVFMSRQPAAGPTQSSGGYLLSPCGDYGISVAGAGPGAPGQTMLTGLFGSERLSFTTWDPADATKGCLLRFRPGGWAYAPVFPFADASMSDPDAGSVATRRLTGAYRTSWANLVGPNALYRAEPDGGAYYGGAPAAGAPLLGPAPPATSVPQLPCFYVPVAPYAAYVPDPGWSDPAKSVGAFEAQILSATRKMRFGGAGSPARQARMERHLARATAASPAATGEWTTTRQGLLAEAADADGATDFLEIDLAQFRIRSADGGGLDQFAFVNPSHIVQEALQTSQLFVAAVSNVPFASPAVFKNIVDIEDWQFVVDVGAAAQLTDYSNVLILKYCDGTLIDWVKNPNKWTDPADFSLIDANLSAIAYSGLSTWLAAYLQDAIDKAGGAKPNPLYANIAAIAQQPDWKGFLALKASLPPAAALPPQIEGLAAGIDPKRFYAHHFGATLSRVKPNPDQSAAQTLIIDGVSSLFGLIDYQDPLYIAAIDAGSDPDTPLRIDATDPFGFRVLNLQALFVNARMTSFQSRIQITLNQLFEAPVKTTQRGGSGSWAVQPGNGIVLDGSAVNQNGTTVYVFQQSNPSLFTFDTPALNAITVSRVQFNTLGVQNWAWPSGPAVPTITSRFLFWGAFDFPVVGAPGAPFDLLSFGSDPAGAVTGQGLAYSNLQITMRSPQATPGVTDFAFDPSNLAFDLGASTLRAGSLFKSLGLQLQSFIDAPAGKTPLDYGFLTVAPEGPDLSELGDGWCGIVHKVNMGGPGALVSAAGFSSQLLVAWSPIAGASPALFVGLSLPGTAPGASVFSLQGVFKITTGAISLQQATLGQFTVKIANIGATFLGIKKIPDGTINFFLFGDPDGTGSLGWYAAYNEAKPSPAPPPPPPALTESVR